MNEKVVFDQLSKDAIDITEILRGGSLDGTAKLFDSIKASYDNTIESLKVKSNTICPIL